jgi:putative copper export protein
MVIFGGTAFRFYALDGSAASVGLIEAFDEWLRRVALAAALALMSALALVLCQAAAMAGSQSATFDPATVKAVLFETRLVGSGSVICFWLLSFCSLASARRGIGRRLC